MPKLKLKGEDDLGLISLYWGDGKGKTTAALGLALRALGHGLWVHLIQFFKGGSKAGFQEYGELIALRRFERFSVEQFGVSDWIIGEPTPEQREVGQRALAASERAISSGEYDLVILDEILYAVSFGVLSVDDILDLLRQKAPQTEVVLTGSHRRLPELEAVVDLVTEVKKVKHPYDRGIKARKGVEY
ncbi:TPA: cob(I)yrinic acid a,c-diamide adenosyltransferase [Candidatus Bipolaricaulota bacterium]|nr:cob(I)yrinic acid a,c-diamide adenosyltransferase [Candidatus Bipolaricaulota bacterium]